MTIIMTVAGVDCDAKVLDNEITCRIPKNMTIPSEGLAVKVSHSLLRLTAAERCLPRTISGFSNCLTIPLIAGSNWLLINTCGVLIV